MICDVIDSKRRGRTEPASSPQIQKRGINYRQEQKRGVLSESGGSAAGHRTRSGVRLEVRSSPRVQAGTHVWFLKQRLIRSFMEAQRRVAGSVGGQSQAPDEFV